jgi:hypothetical protein
MRAVMLQVKNVKLLFSLSTGKHQKTGKVKQKNQAQNWGLF